MSPWPDKKIAVIASRYIRKSSMDPSKWCHTRLDSWDERIPLDVAEGELPLVTIYLGQSSWVAFTSRRIVGVQGAVEFDLAPMDVIEHRWGDNPKGVGGAGSGTATLHLRDGRIVEFQFEAGAAWMGPIQAMRFWQLKFPVLDNLAV